MSIAQAISLLFLSGFASVDRLAGFNIMLSRPFIVAGIVGYMFDNIMMCLLVGILFEFIGMLEVPVGTTITKDDTFGGYATAVVISVIPSINNSLGLLLCVAVVILFIYPVTITDRYCRQINQYLIAASIKEEKHDYESKLINLGLITAFFRGVLVYNAALLGVFVIMVLFTKYTTVQSDNPYMSMLLLYTFVGAYLFKFFTVDLMYKVVLLSLGIFFGGYVL